MEYLDGEDLVAVVERRGRIPLAEAVGYMLQACTALAEAHAAGIVHRDLKPANLFLAVSADRTASIKVLDFGISKITDPHDEVRVTQAWDTMGSPLYVAPEQMISARDVDPRADIWALGVILYELATGRSPFNGRTATHICGNVLQAKYAPPSSVVPELAGTFEKIVARCLTRDPSQRYQTVVELAGALARLVPQRRRTGERSAAPSSRGRRTWAWIAAALVGGAVAMAMAPHRTEAATSVPEAMVAAPLFEDAASLVNPERAAAAARTHDVPDSPTPAPARTAERRGRLELPRTRGRRLTGDL